MQILRKFASLWLWLLICSSSKMMPTDLYLATGKTNHISYIKTIKKSFRNMSKAKNVRRTKNIKPHGLLLRDASNGYPQHVFRRNKKNINTFRFWLKKKVPYLELSNKYVTPVYCIVLPSLVPFVWSAEGPVPALGVPPCWIVQSKLSPTFTFVHVHRLLLSKLHWPEITCQLILEQPRNWKLFQLLLKIISIKVENYLN